MLIESTNTNTVSFGGEISLTVESSGADGLGLPGEVVESLEHERAKNIRNKKIRSLEVCMII
jgi:hypothetical protein